MSVFGRIPSVGWSGCEGLLDVLVVAGVIVLGMHDNVAAGGFFGLVVWSTIFPLFDSGPVAKKVQVSLCQYRLQFLSTLVLKSD